MFTDRLRKIVDAISAGAVRPPSLSERLSSEEAALWAIINRALPPATLNRYRLLQHKARQENLTDAEYDELCRLTDEVEILHADRVKALIHLASLRGEPLDDLATSTGIAVPVNG